MYFYFICVIILFRLGSEIMNNWKLERAKEIVKLLHVGVENEDGEVRKFNILDYYKIINISPKTLYETTAADLREEYSDSEVNNFRSFALRSLSDTKLTIKAIMEVKHSVMVNNELREITDYEKTSVIQYLKNNKLPLTADVYAITLKEYLNGQLSLEVINDNSKALMK